MTVDSGGSVPDAVEIGTASADVVADNLAVEDTAVSDGSVSQSSANGLETDDGEPATSGGKAARLDEEGDVAADYLEELLDIADLDGDIDIEIRSGRTYISIVSEDGTDKGLEALVGEDGEVLEALQELTRLSVLTATETRSRLVLDVDGYRDRRGKELGVIAQDAVKKVQETGEEVVLPPMSAYERKIVHDVVADLGLLSESEGEGPARHIVVSPSDD